MKYYIADTHFGHENCIRFDERPFKDVREMDRDMLTRWNSVVQDRDDVYILGDITFCHSDEYRHKILSSLKGKKHLIIGNHDGWIWKGDPRARIYDPDYAKYFVSIGQIDFVQDWNYEIVLCHYPMVEWPKMYHGAIHFYGHIHGHMRGNTGEALSHINGAYNVGCMLHNYYPVTCEQILRGG